MAGTWGLPSGWYGRQAQSTPSADIGVRIVDKKSARGMEMKQSSSETWEMVASEYRKVKYFTWNGRISRLNGRFERSTVDVQSSDVRRGR